jgi:hypothetical protein
MGKSGGFASFGLHADKAGGCSGSDHAYQKSLKITNGGSAKGIANLTHKVYSGLTFFEKLQTQRLNFNGLAPYHQQST